MFEVYLPIADVKADLFVLVFIGMATGILSGIFGLGGGLISVPFLTIAGVPPQISVATATNQMTAGTLSSCIAYARNKRVDFKLGYSMLSGGLLGNLIGIFVFSHLKTTGNLDAFISISFFFLLSIIGTKTAYEGVVDIYNHIKRNGEHQKLGKHSHWFYSMPFRTKFLSIEEKVSILIPSLVGMIGGFFVLMLGIGGGFIMIPAMLYLLRSDEKFISGTIQFQIIFTSIFATILHAFAGHGLDIILSIILIIATVIGSQIGARIGMNINPKKFRFVLAIIILSIALKIGLDLFLEPESIYKIDQLGK